MKKQALDALPFENLKAVFVDLDGTLVDSMPILYKVYCEFLKNFGIDGSFADFETLIGPSICEVVLLLKERYQLKEGYGELLEKYYFLLNFRYESEVQLFDHARECLEFLKESSLQLVLVTSAIASSADAIISRLDIKKFFNSRVTADSVQKSKPNPEIYEKALEIANVTARQAVAIEDSSVGLQAALSANIVPIWIRNEKKAFLKYHKDPFLIEVSDWRGVYNLFKKWQAV
jgi:beta-phosphoglucomutase